MAKIDMKAVEKALEDANFAEVILIFAQGVDDLDKRVNQLEQRFKQLDALAKQYGGRR
jgi:hypothetical protein